MIIVNSTIEHLACVFLTPVGGEIYTSETNNKSTNSNATLHHNRDQITWENKILEENLLKRTKALVFPNFPRSKARKNDMT